jgi:hypothetical protein
VYHLRADAVSVERTDLSADRQPVFASAGQAQMEAGRRSREASPSDDVQWSEMQRPDGTWTIVRRDTRLERPSWWERVIDWLWWWP